MYIIILKRLFLCLSYRINNATTFRYISIYFSIGCFVQTELEQHDLESCKAHVTHNLANVQS